MNETLVHQSHPEIVKRLRRAEGHLRRVIAMMSSLRSGGRAWRSPSDIFRDTAVNHVSVRCSSVAGKVGLTYHTAFAGADPPLLRVATVWRKSGSAFPALSADIINRCAAKPRYEATIKFFKLLQIVRKFDLVEMPARGWGQDRDPRRQRGQAPRHRG